MNDVFNPHRFVRIARQMQTARLLSLSLLPLLTLAIAAWLTTGCDAGDARVKLSVRPSPTGSPLRLDLQAQVTGSPAGLRYKWFAVSGGCDPQESDLPATQFQFADGVIRDRISVEVWRDERRIARAEIDVKFDEALAQQISKRSPPVQVEITTIPPSESGGPETRADIAGKVSGKIEPGDKIVIYAYAYDYWHIQPLAHAMHPIAADNTWAHWIHTGTSYAALVVEAGYEPRVRLDILPRVGGPVLARTVVEGRK